jgi:hypothetical protein
MVSAYVITKISNLARVVWGCSCPRCIVLGPDGGSSSTPGRRVLWLRRVREDSALLFQVKIGVDHHAEVSEDVNRPGPLLSGSGGFLVAVAEHFWHSEHDGDKMCVHFELLSMPNGNAPDIKLSQRSIRLGQFQQLLTLYSFAVIGGSRK